MEHPRKEIVSIAEGLAWAGGALFQEKMDGVFNVRNWRGNTLAGELMPGGRFVAWDCLATAAGGDCQRAPAIDRFTALILARERLAEDGIDLVPFTIERGGELLAAVLARGGEGVVRKELSAPYSAAMLAAKRVQTWRCVVTGFLGGSQSVTIADAITGAERGKVALRGGKCDRVRVGSVLKVEGVSLTARGMIREPRVCKDTPDSWLISF